MQTLFTTDLLSRKIPPMKRAVLVVVLMALTCGSMRSQAQNFSDSPAFDCSISRAADIKWYFKYLNAFSEPSLWAASKDSRRQLCRFLWLRTWDQAIIVRVDRNDDETATLILKTPHGGSDSDEPGTQGIVRMKKLSKEELVNIAEKFTTSGFWTMPSTASSNGHEEAQWVLEATTNGHYHAMDGWSPKNGALQGLALYLLQLADFKIVEDKCCVY